MTQESPQLRELAEELISNGAGLLRVYEDLLESNFVLVTAHGDWEELGPTSDSYDEHRSIEAVQVADEQFQFDYEFDATGPTLFGCQPLYVAEGYDDPVHGITETSLDEGLKSVFGSKTGGRK